MSTDNIFDIELPTPTQGPFAGRSKLPDTLAPNAPPSTGRAWAAPFFSARTWYALGAFLSALLLFALYNPTPWAVRASGWPHEAFRGADGAWMWVWDREQATVVFLVVCTMLSLSAALLVSSRARGVLGILVGLFAATALAPTSDQLPFFLLPLLMTVVVAGLLMPRGTSRSLTLAIGMTLLAAHFFLPWSQLQVDTAHLPGSYQCVALHVIGNYTDPAVEMQPDSTGNRPEAPANQFTAYLLIFAVTVPTTLGLLLLIFGALAVLGIAPRWAAMASAALLTVLVLAMTSIQFVDGWQKAPTDALPITGWEGGLKAFGETFRNSFVIFALPAAAGLLDLARSFLGRPSRS